MTDEKMSRHGLSSHLPAASHQGVGNEGRVSILTGVWPAAWKCVDDVGPKAFGCDYRKLLLKTKLPTWRRTRLLTQNITRYPRKSSQIFDQPHHEQLVDLSYAATTEASETCNRGIVTS